MPMWAVALVLMVSTLVLQHWIASQTAELGQLAVGVPTLLMVAFMAFMAAGVQLLQRIQAAEACSCATATGVATVAVEAAPLPPALPATTSRARSRIESSESSTVHPRSHSGLEPAEVQELGQRSAASTWRLVESWSSNITSVAQQQQQQQQQASPLVPPIISRSSRSNWIHIGRPDELVQAGWGVPISPDFADSDVEEQEEPIEFQPSQPPPLEDIEDEEETAIEEADASIEPLDSAAPQGLTTLHPPPPVEEEEMEPVEEIVKRLSEDLSGEQQETAAEAAEAAEAAVEEEKQVKSEFCTGTGRVIMLSPDGEQRAQEVLMVEEEEDEEDADEEEEWSESDAPAPASLSSVDLRASPFEEQSRSASPVVALLTIHARTEVTSVLAEAAAGEEEEVEENEEEGNVGLLDEEDEEMDSANEHKYSSDEDEFENEGAEVEDYGEVYEDEEDEVQHTFHPDSTRSEIEEASRQMIAKLLREDSGLGRRRSKPRKTQPQQPLLQQSAVKTVDIEAKKQEQKADKNERTGPVFASHTKKQQQPQHEDEPEEEEEAEAEQSTSSSPPPAVAGIYPSARPRKPSRTQKLFRSWQPAKKSKRRRGLEQSRLSRERRMQQQQQPKQQQQQHPPGSPAAQPTESAVASPRSQRKRKRDEQTSLPGSTEEGEEEQEEETNNEEQASESEGAPSGTLAYNLRPRRGSTSSAGTHASDGSDSTAPPPSLMDAQAAMMTHKKVPTTPTAAAAAAADHDASVTGDSGPVPKKSRSMRAMVSVSEWLDRMRRIPAPNLARTVGAADAGVRPKDHI